MKILALDLGTKVGHALSREGELVDYGTRLLALDFELNIQSENGSDRRLDIRFSRLIGWLEGVFSSGLDLVVFEDVQFASTSMQAHLWATWRAAVWANASKFATPIDCCATGTLKKFATGSGAALKSDMATALLKTMPEEFKPAPPQTFVRGKRKGQLKPQDFLLNRRGQFVDDNAIDALHLLAWAQKKYGTK